MSEYGGLQHEEVVIRRGRRSGAAITVAVHSRALGPAVGGCRIWTYPSWRDGTADAMRLAEAMTYKCAAAGLEYGGGKTVVALPMGTVLTPQVRNDVLHDVAEIVARSPGHRRVRLGRFTAGCRPLRARAHGRRLRCRRPEARGGKNAGYDWVDPDRALLTPADVLVPAAVGGVLNPRTVAALDVPLIIGPANNQVTSDSVAELLADAGTVWVPDFVTSAGGVIYVLSREVGGLDHEAAAARVEAIEETVNRVLDAARTAGTTPLHESMALAERRLSAAAAE